MDEEVHEGIRTESSHSTGGNTVPQNGLPGESAGLLHVGMLADPAFTRASPEELEQLSRKMEDFAKKFYKKHKIWPHPAQAYKCVKKHQK